MSTLDELIAKTESLDEEWQVYLDSGPPSAKIEHNLRYLQWLLRAAKEVRGDPVITVNDVRRSVTYQAPPPPSRWPNESAESSAKVLFDAGTISEFTPEAFRKWQEARRANR